MQFIFGLHQKQAHTTNPPRIVLSLDRTGIPPFPGFTYSVAEGLRLSRRCYTELPEFQAQQPSP